MKTRPAAACRTALFFLVLGGAPLAAQRADRLQRPGAAGQPRALEQQFQQRLAEVVKRRLNLTDSQMQQLKGVNQRYERERMLLLREERRARQALRAEVLAGEKANQPQVDTLLAQLLGIQRQRLDITDREQRDLAAFMTPTQRAQYFGIQDQLRRRLEELRDQRQQRREGTARRPVP